MSRPIFDRILHAALLLAAAGPAYAGHACVDPADATARRWIQDQPCRLPMFEWPLSDRAKPGDPPRWGSFQGNDAAAQAGHAFFWRFPVQGYAPHGAPSVGPWRSVR